MSPLRNRGPRAPAAWAALSLTILAALAIALPTAGSAAAAVTWRASVGAAGANGQAAITAPATAGTAGSLKLALKGLAASATYPVKVHAGTCAAPGSALFAAPSQKSTAAGKISKVVPVPAAKMNAIRLASSLVLRVGSGSKLRCGPFTGGPPPTPSPTPTPTPTIGVTADVGTGLVTVTADDASVWAIASGQPIAYRLDPATAATAATVDYGSSLKMWSLGIKLAFNGDAALGLGSLWVEGYDFTKEIRPSVFEGNGVILRIDTTSLGVVAKIVGDGDLRSVEVAGGIVWTLGARPDRLVRIDPATNAIASSVALPATPLGLAMGGGSAWVTTKTGVVRVDLTTQSVTSLDLGAETAGIAFADGTVWVAVEKTNDAPAKLLRISATDVTVAGSVELPGRPGGVAAGGGYVWVAPADADAPRAVAVSPAASRIVGEVVLPGALESVAVRGRSAWFAGKGEGTAPDVVRVDY